jgi:antitoxin (DNA-binding transcriptional repressor) of toxin-antitoxin stability system
MKASIVDLRYHMKDVLRAIDRGETVTVLYRGREKARLVPVQEKKPAVRAEDMPMFGMWADREDMADPAAYIRKLREPRFASLLKEGLLPVSKPKRKPRPAASRRRPASKPRVKSR